MYSTVYTIYKIYLSPMFSMYFCMLDALGLNFKYKCIQIISEHDYRSIWQGKPSHYSRSILENCHPLPSSLDRLPYLTNRGETKKLNNSKLLQPCIQNLIEYNRYICKLTGQLSAKSIEKQHGNWHQHMHICATHITVIFIDQYTLYHTISLHLCLKWVNKFPSSLQTYMAPVLHPKCIQMYR